ncbi:MAG: hypothetical protein K2O08_01120, partial [Clostridia bacterium]|nr:hypothetical protein [Clostridia bacterium]
MAYSYGANGEIAVAEKFHKKVCFDVANNLISAQFDGRGGISKYAVMNKFSVFTAFYPLYTINGKPIGYASDKRVEMLGKKQITTFSENGAEIKITQFLDTKTNCIFVENNVAAIDSDIDFDLTTNFGVNYESYVQQLLANRLSLGNISKIVNGLLKKKKRDIVDFDGTTYNVSYTHIRAHETSIHRVCRLIN